MPISMSKVSRSLSDLKSRTFNAMLAAVLLLMLGLQALLLSGSFTMGVYCLLLTCAIMIGETFVPSHFDMDPSNAYIDLIGRNLEAYMHRGTFYLLASLPIFLSRQPSWPGCVSCRSFVLANDGSCQVIHFKGTPRVHCT